MSALGKLEVEVGEVLSGPRTRSIFRPIIFRSLRIAAASYMRTVYFPESYSQRHLQRTEGQVQSLWPLLVVALN